MWSDASDRGPIGTATSETFASNHKAASMTGFLKIEKLGKA